MPLFDYACLGCGWVLNDKFAKADEIRLCELCEQPMVRLPSAPATIDVKGYSAANGYASKEGPHKPNLDGIRTYRVK